MELHVTKMKCMTSLQNPCETCNVIIAPFLPFRI